MHKGVYIGDNFSNCHNKLLILGESHHSKEPEALGHEANYTSTDVVNNYLDAKMGKIKMIRSWYFFTKIAHSFNNSWNNNAIIDFYKKVAFGNYIDVCCGVKTGHAAKYLNNADKITKLNFDLFYFLNEKRVDNVLLVSKLVASKLPEADNSFNLGENNCIMVKQYNKGHLFKNLEDSVILNKEIKVYIIKHPSGYGYKPSEYNEILKGLID